MTPTEPILEFKCNIRRLHRLLTDKGAINMEFVTLRMENIHTPDSDSPPIRPPHHPSPNTSPTSQPYFPETPHRSNDDSPPYSHSPQHPGAYSVPPFYPPYGTPFPVPAVPDQTPGQASQSSESFHHALGGLGYEADGPTPKPSSPIYKAVAASQDVPACAPEPLSLYLDLVLVLSLVRCAERWEANPPFVPTQLPIKAES